MNKEQDFPLELFLRPGNAHPLERIFDRSQVKNAIRRVTEEDRRELVIDAPRSILDWLAERKPCIPRQSIENLVNETTEPLLSYTLRRELRVHIESMEPVEAVGRVIKLRVKPKDRARVPVLIMLPCEENLEQAWDLYYYSVRYWLKYLLQTDGEAQADQQVGENGARWHILHAKACFRATMREMISLSPEILARGELAYLLYQFVKILDSLETQKHQPYM
jgi:hypothetical protein